MVGLQIQSSRSEGTSGFDYCAKQSTSDARALEGWGHRHFRNFKFLFAHTTKGTAPNTAPIYDRKKYLSTSIQDCALRVRKNNSFLRLDAKIALDPLFI